MAKKTHVYPKEGTDREKDTIRKLKAQVKRLEKELDLKCRELKQLRTVFTKNETQMVELSDNYTLEELVEKAKTPQEKIREEMRSIFCEKSTGKTQEEI